MDFRIKRAIKWVAAVIAIVVVVFFAYFIMLFINAENPSMEMETARKAVGKAHKAHADVYAPEIYGEAKRGYDQAMLEWRRQNELYFFQRDFSKCKKLALRSTIKGEEAFSKSGINKNNLRDNYIRDVKVLNEKLEMYHRVFKDLPLTSRVRKDYEFGKLTLAESLSAFEKNDFKTATAKLAKTKSRIAQSDLLANGFLKDYFLDFNNWRTWYNNAIEKSKEGVNVIIVNKFEHKLYVYSGGNKIAEFDVEFGKNWLGPKKMKGDFATPEGEYRITKKKESRETRYYRALCVNYPNDADYARFSEMKRKGVIAKNRDIGGLIEVHGDGGKGADWTEGCVALSNSDMDKLFKLTSPGTPITIIGSLKPLKDILN